MFLKSAKFEIMYNFFLNPYNLYEITTFNRTKYGVVLSLIIDKILYIAVITIGHHVGSRPC